MFLYYLLYAASFVVICCLNSNFLPLFALKYFFRCCVSVAIGGVVEPIYEFTDVDFILGGRVVEFANVFINPSG